MWVPQNSISKPLTSFKAMPIVPPCPLTRGIPLLHWEHKPDFADKNSNNVRGQWKRALIQRLLWEKAASVVSLVRQSFELKML